MNKRRQAGPISARNALVLSLLAATGWPVAAQAQTEPAAARPAAMESLIACRGVTDSTQRLACYDRAIGAFDQAEKAGDLVVVDKGQVREAKRRAFGFDFDAFNIFNRGEATVEVDNIDLTVERAYRDREGKLVIVMAEGQTWRQVDSERLGREPRKGSKAAVRKAALGSYFMNLDGQRAIRARREK
jgi:hypothetical protein